MNEKYISITGFRNYSGILPFKIGYLVRCEKETDNPYDSEAIRCTMPIIGTVGYVANSCNTVAGGTMSAGRVYDKVGKKYRVDKMTEISALDRSRDGKDEFKKVGMPQYFKRVFGMFTGDMHTVRLQFENRLASPVIDRFGRDITMLASDESHFIVNVDVAVSPRFFHGCSALEPKWKFCRRRVFGKNTDKDFCHCPNCIIYRNRSIGE